MADPEKKTPVTEEVNDVEETDDHEQKFSEFMSNPQVWSPLHEINHKVQIYDYTLDYTWLACQSSHKWDFIRLIR